MTDPAAARFPYRLLVGALLVILLALGGLLVRQYLAAPQGSPAAESKRQLRNVTLYFATIDGLGLAAEVREIDDSPREQDNVQATVRALLAGPTGSLVPVFPVATRLRGINIVGSEAQVDFGHELVDAHPGGSWSELLTIYALADTLAVNFPQLRQVRILVDGAQVETLKGHVDLSQPVTPDFRLVVKPATSPQAGRVQ